MNSLNFVDHVVLSFKLKSGFFFYSREVFSAGLCSTVTVLPFLRALTFLFSGVC